MTRGLLIVAVLGPSSVASDGTARLRYAVTDLGLLPGGRYTVARTVSASGAMAGWGSVPGGTHAVFWEHGILTDLGTLGGTQSQAWGVNSTGTVVGWSHVGPGMRTIRAFVWQGGAMTDLGTLGGRNSGAGAINDPGQVVGWAELLTGDLNQHAFRWESGVMTDLGTLGGPSSEAYDINAAGDIVGRAGTSNFQQHAFLYREGVMVDLGTLPNGTRSRALGINDLGQVVGSAYTTPDPRSAHAFLWECGVMTDLGTLGGMHSVAFSINNNTQVVGESAVSESEAHPFIWEDGVMTDLNNLIPPRTGWNLYRAYDINDAGQIVGSGETGGAIHGFLLTPLPRETVLDIKPGSCPNPLKVRSRGMVPMAVVGSESFDVTEIDMDSLALRRADGAGGSVTPWRRQRGPRTRIGDVATPLEGDLCDCHGLRSDGIDDLVLKFSTRQMVRGLALNGVPRGTSVTLTLSGSLLDGTSFQASDCIVMTGRTPRGDPRTTDRSPQPAAGESKPTR